MRQSRKRSKFKNILIVLLACSFVFFFSQLVLTLARLLLNEIDTNVLSLRKEDQSVIYFVPRTAGGTENCSVPAATFITLHEGDEIVVLRTSFLNRCAGVRKITCQGVLCSFRQETINADNLIQEALKLEYRGRYKTASELAADFPGYSPEVRRWPDIRSRVFEPRYSVRLPDRLMIFDTRGTYLTSRECGSVEGLCKKVTRKSDH